MKKRKNKAYVINRILKTCEFYVVFFFSYFVIDEFETFIRNNDEFIESFIDCFMIDSLEKIFIEIKWSIECLNLIFVWTMNDVSIKRRQCSFFELLSI